MEKNNPSNIRLGVIGTGSMGKNHARIFSEMPNAKFAAVLDTREDVAREMAAKFGAEPVTSLEKFISLVDAATVATPTVTHFEIAKALLEAGKHVLVEKPFTETPEQARELCDLAQRRGLVLQVGHIERFNPVMPALEKRLNAPRFIEATRLSPYPGRSLDVGVVLDVMIHDLEIILHLVRSPWVQVDAVGVAILSKREDIAKTKASVETEHLFPLLRGRGVSAFKAQPDPEYSVLVPQRSMQGNPELPAEFPATFRYLKRFQSVLKLRSSFRRFQKKQAWWSLWSTGAYSFARYKVAWREMPGGRFAAAIVSPVRHPQLGTKLVVLDHKLYFVPCRSLKEAAFLTALLNAPIVSEAISAYASQLSLGVSVVEYLALPQFNSKNSTHRALVSLALSFTKKVSVPSPAEWDQLDSLAHTAFNLP